MTSSGHAAPDQLAVTLRRTAADLMDKRTVRDLELALSQVVAAAVAMVPGAAGGGISRTEAGTVHSSHATTDLIGRCDQEQSRVGQGPCIEAAEHPSADGVVLVHDMAGADGDRWPRFAPFVIGLGYRSMLSTNLLARPGGPRTALNLYASEPDVFDADARRTAAIFAVQAATLLYGADEAQLLGRAVDNRDIIGQAKGILMERLTIDGAEAFQMLASSSQNTNMKLVDVARWLVDEAGHRRHSSKPAGAGT